MCAGAVTEKEIQQSIRTIRSVGPEGEGNTKAGRAWETLSKADASALTTILTSMDNASPLAMNWLRGAIYAIADRAIDSGKSVSVADLKQYIAKTEHNPRARRLAFDLINRVDPDTAKAMIPGMINDPSVELRRDAVRQVLDRGVKEKKNGSKDAATKTYQTALRYGRDVDQIQKAASALRELGHTVDLPKQFGFLMDWHVVGPFDNTDRQGFARVFRPEKGVDLNATYPGKAGTVKWQALTTEDQYGMLDFNKPYGMIKEVTGYAYTEYEAERERKAEIRLGCKNAWKVWLNGEIVFGRDEYHRGARIDQYKLPITLKQGNNTILVKACQNEQDESWTREWQFQMRISDEAGTPLMAKNRKPTPPAALSPKSGK